MAESERDFRGVLQNMIALGASDLHLKVGSAPTMRIDGTLFTVEEPTCSPADLEHLLEDLIGKDKRD
ncbi:MAG: hypothetical protein ACRDF6_07490, partial [bacterium]